MGCLRILFGKIDSDALIENRFTLLLYWLTKPYWRWKLRQAIDCPTTGSWAVERYSRILSEVGDGRAVPQMIRAMGNHFIDSTISDAIVGVGRPAVWQLIPVLKQCGRSYEMSQKLRMLPPTLGRVGGVRAQRALADEMRKVGGDTDFKRHCAISLLESGWRPSETADREIIQQVVRGLREDGGTDSRTFSGWLNSRIRKMPDIEDLK